MVANGFKINPYGGRFDVGDSTTQQGWNGWDPYSTTLTGVGTALSLDKFKVKDSISGVYAAIHIQNIGSASGGNCDGRRHQAACAPGVTGPGSLKIGASTYSVPVPDGGSTLALLGAALLGLGALRRLR